MHVSPLGAVTMVASRTGSAYQTATSAATRLAAAQRIAAESRAPVTPLPSPTPHLTAEYLMRGQAAQHANANSVIDALTRAPDAIAPQAPPTEYTTVSEGKVYPATASGQITGPALRTATGAPVAEKKSLLPLLIAAASMYFLGA